MSTRKYSEQCSAAFPSYFLFIKPIFDIFLSILCLAKAFSINQTILGIQKGGYYD
jgi:hypothetical protein